MNRIDLTKYASKMNSTNLQYFLDNHFPNRGTDPDDVSLLSTNLSNAKMRFDELSSAFEKVRLHLQDIEMDFVGSPNPILSQPGFLRVILHITNERTIDFPVDVKSAIRPSRIFGEKWRKIIVEDELAEISRLTLQQTLTR